MSNEVKRWWIDLRPHSNARAQGYSTRHSAWSRPIVRFGVNAVCVMPVKDHERIVAGLKEELEVFRNREYGFENELELKQTIDELRAEVAQAKREAADAMSGCCDCPMFKAQGKTVARQARVIEKLTEQRNRAANRHHKQSLNKYLERISKFEEEIKAIENGEA